MRPAIRFSHVPSVVIANASGMGFPEKIACNLYPTAVRLTPRPHVASRSVVWLGSSSGLPSTTTCPPTVPVPCVLLSWLKGHHGLEPRVAQGVSAIAHNPPEYRAREQSRLDAPVADANPKRHRVLGHLAEPGRRHHPHHRLPIDERVHRLRQVLVRPGLIAADPRRRA